MFGIYSDGIRCYSNSRMADPDGINEPPQPHRKGLPKSFKDLTPTKSFAPKKFFKEFVLKPLFRRRQGEHRKPDYPELKEGEVALTWIGHASFLIQFTTCNIVVDPIFADWIFILKRLRRAGLHIEDLPPVDIVLLSHAHFDHFHKKSIRKIAPPKIGIMPWGMGKLARRLGFERIIELKWWESFEKDGYRFTMTPCKHWGARTIHDQDRGYGGFVIEHQGRKVYHAGDSAYFDGFTEIGKRLSPEIALLPIGAYYPDSFRNVHMGPDDAMQAYHDLNAKQLIPMHYGSFKLSFEEMDEPPRWLKRLADEQGITEQLHVMDEGVPQVF